MIANLPFLFPRAVRITYLLDLRIMGGRVERRRRGRRDASSSSSSSDSSSSESSSSSSSSADRRKKKRGGRSKSKKASKRVEKEKRGRRGRSPSSDSDSSSSSRKGRRKTKKKKDDKDRKKKGGEKQKEEKSGPSKRARPFNPLSDASRDPWEKQSFEQRIRGLSEREIVEKVLAEGYIDETNCCRLLRALLTMEDEYLHEGYEPKTGKLLARIGEDLKAIFRHVDGGEPLSIDAIPDAGKKKKLRHLFQAVRLEKDKVGIRASLVFAGGGALDAGSLGEGPISFARSALDLEVRGLRGVGGGGSLVHA